MPFLKPFFSGFIQILHHCSMSWKIVPLYFFFSNLIYFWQKEPIKVKFSGFWVVDLKITKFHMSYLKPQVSFSLNFAPLWRVRDNSCVLFSWNFVWFGWKEPIKVENIRLLTAHIKFQMKKYREVMYHDTEE